MTSHVLVRTFIQGVTEIAPPVCALLPPWDLSLAISALQKPPFEAIRAIPLTKAVSKDSLLDRDHVGLQSF